MSVSGYQPFPCAVCGRAAGHMVISVAHKPGADFCSDECGRAWMIKGGDLKAIEKEAVQAGGEAAGAYLDSIGKTDLAKLTADEWATFCATLYKATTDDLRRQALDSIPF